MLFALLVSPVLGLGFGFGFGLGLGLERPKRPIRVAFEPRAGAVVARELTGALDVDIEEAALRIGGGEWFDVRPWMAPTGSIEVGGTLRTRDVYLESVAGHPRVLDREYELFKSRWGLGRRWDSYRVLHPLSLRTVRFVRGPDGAYAASWAPRRRGGRDVLEALSEDLDFRVLLPASPVVVGNRWSVPWAALGPVLLPGGRIHRHPELWEEFGLAALEASLASQLPSCLEQAHATCELERVDDDPPTAVIALSFEHDNDVDFALDLGGTRPAALGFGTLEGRLAFDIWSQGRLEWDLSAGRAAAFTLDTRFGFDATATSLLGAEPAELRVSAGGRLCWDVRVSAHP